MLSLVTAPRHRLPPRPPGAWRTPPPTTARRPASATRPASSSSSTTAFTLMFAVWLMFGVLGVAIKDELRLNKIQFSWLTAIAVLSGSVWRLPIGIVTDRVGGRRLFIWLMIATADPVCAGGVGAVVPGTHRLRPLLRCRGQLVLGRHRLERGVGQPRAAGLRARDVRRGKRRRVGHQADRADADHGRCRRPGCSAARCPAGGARAGHLRGAAGDHGRRPRDERARARPAAGGRRARWRDAAPASAGADLALRPLLRRGVRRLRRAVAVACRATTRTSSTCRCRRRRC